MTIAALALLATLTLAGAWIADGDIFHSIWYLSAIALVFVNLAACTLLRMAPGVLPAFYGAEFRTHDQITGLGLRATAVTGSRMDRILQHMQARGFSVRRQDNLLVLEKGRIGRLAALLTHLGLFVGLAGVAASSAGGYSGLITASPGTVISFPPERHQLAVGVVPRFNLKVLHTWRQNHPDGEVKQWYSTLRISASDGRPLAEGTTCVNHPFSFAQVDFYQSQWELREARMQIGKHNIIVPLSAAGQEYAGLVPLSRELTLIVSVAPDCRQLTIYLRSPGLGMHKLGVLAPAQTLTANGVPIKFTGLVPVTGIL